MKTLKQIPVPVAVLVMVICILAGIAFGNHNALANAKEAPEVILKEVSSLAAQRVGSAKNLIALAGRNDVSDTDKQALQSATDALEDARKASRIAEANSSLTFASNAVIDQLKAVASEADRKLTVGVEDELLSQNQRLTRVANTYNESVEEVRRVYNTLPMRWLIGGMPEVYK